MAGTVYIVANTLNGNQYVGQTIVANQVISEETKHKLSEAAKRQWARQKGI